MAADDDLKAFQDWLANLGASIPDVAVEVAKVLEKDVKATAAAGTTYDGTAWPLTEKGVKALPGVENHIKSEAQGNLVVTTVEGVYAYHNNAKNEDYRRRILPDSRKGLPARLNSLLRSTALRVLARRK